MSHVRISWGRTVSVSLTLTMCVTRPKVAVSVPAVPAVGDLSSFCYLFRVLLSASRRWACKNDMLPAKCTKKPLTVPHTDLEGYPGLSFHLMQSIGREGKVRDWWFFWTWKHLWVNRWQMRPRYFSGSSSFFLPFFFSFILSLLLPPLFPFPASFSPPTFFFETDWPQPHGSLLPQELQL